MKKITFLVFILFQNLLAQGLPTLDEELAEIIKKHELGPLEKPTRSPRELTRLGAMLFHERELSGTREISCAQCHHPRFGTSDGIPFSQGVLGLTKRHSPHVLNLGYPEISTMFWDGRVHYDQEEKVFTTPEPALNGKEPKRKDIVKVLKSSLSAQAIFPLLSELEMRGDQGNEIAEAPNNLEAWKRIMERLFKLPRYQKQFKEAYPKESQFNIGHVGEALGSFMKDSFNVIDTPYDRYLRGDLSALTPSEKRGLVVFANRGKCIKCHNGVHLSNFEFKTVATPQLTPIAYKAPYDQGRYEVTGEKSDLFKFRTPALRNLVITAPYMHNGVFQTLEEVIEHYNNPSLSLNNYDQTMTDLSAYTGEEFVVDRDKLRNKLRVNLISIGEVRRGINLTQAEKEDLLRFLKRGLLDYRFHRQLGE